MVLAQGRRQAVRQTPCSRHRSLCHRGRRRSLRPPRARAPAWQRRPQATFSEARHLQGTTAAFAFAECARLRRQLVEMIASHNSRFAGFLPEHRGCYFFLLFLIFSGRCNAAIRAFFPRRALQHIGNVASAGSGTDCITSMQKQGTLMAFWGQPKKRAPDVDPEAPTPAKRTALTPAPAAASVGSPLLQAHCASRQ